MASSSLSQEDYEHDFELSSRRSRIRTARAATVRTLPIRTGGDATPVGEADAENQPGVPIPGTTPVQTDPDTIGLSSSFVDHDASPKAIPRTKDKRGSRTNYINKGKVQRERRKLREKRRSTGVVHLQSTESTGGSTGEDDESLITAADTKKNTNLNENLCKEEVAVTEAPSQVKAYPRQNKSPSDLDADDEEYDSTLNQSDSTVSLGGPGSEVSGQSSSAAEVAPPPATALDSQPAETTCLEALREEVAQLRVLVSERDQRISALEAKLLNIHTQMLMFKTQNKKLQEENRSLLNALMELKT